MLIPAYTYVFFILVYVLVDYEIFEKNYKSVVEIDSSLIKFVHSWLFLYSLNLVAGIQRNKGSKWNYEKWMELIFLSISSCEERHSHTDVNAASSKSHFS